MTTNEPMRAAYEDETLVAYLDGELSSEEITAINSSLQHDSDLRKRIENLRTTWDLLEELPNEKPNFALVQSTIEMVSLAIAQEKKSWLQRILGNRWAMLTLATMLAFAVGVVTAQKRTSVQNQQFLEDLPIFVHYKEFANVDSTDWLKKLGSIDDLVRAAVRRQSVAEEMLPAALEGRSNWVKAADAGMRASIFEGQVAFRKDERSITGYL